MDELKEALQERLTNLLQEFKKDAATDLTEFASAISTDMTLAMQSDASSEHMNRLLRQLNALQEQYQVKLVSKGLVSLNSILMLVFEVASKALVATI